MRGLRYAESIQLEATRRLEWLEHELQKKRIVPQFDKWNYADTEELADEERDQTSTTLAADGENPSAKTATDEKGRME